MTQLLAKQLIARAVLRGHLPPGSAAGAERRVAAGEPLAEVLRAAGVAPAVADALADASLMGRTLGRFRLEALLGCGAMGTVFRARQAGLERDVAVKVFDPRLASDPVEAARFRREAQAACRLDHPNVNQPIDFGDEGGLLYLAMELATGGSAEARLLAAGPFAEAAVLETVEGIARALDYAASRGIVHRDVKPGNIFYAAAGTPKLGDLGLVLDQRAERLTGRFAAVGTPTYMAPEQALAKELTAKADVYALGIAAYELLAGVPPFVGEEPIDVVQQHMRSPPPDVRERRPEVSEALARLIQRMTAKTPEERPAPGEVATIARAIASGPAPAPPPPPPPSPAPAPSLAPEMPPTRPPAPSSTPLPPRIPATIPSRRLFAHTSTASAPSATRRVVVVALAPVLLALLGALVASYLSTRPPAIDPAAEARALATLGAALLERRAPGGGFGETVDQPPDPWVTGQCLEALLLVGDPAVARRLGVDLARLEELALDGASLGEAPGFAGFPYAVGDTAPCVEATCAVARAAALACGRVDRDPAPFARRIFEWLLRVQAPSGAFATIPSLGDAGAMTSATTDAIAALSALAAALGEEKRALPAVERAAVWLAARYDADRNAFAVNPRRASGEAWHAPGLDESAALSLLEACALARRAGAPERPAVREVLLAIHRHPPRADTHADLIGVALVEDYRFQRLLPPGQRTTAAEFAWLVVSWRVVLASRLAAEQDVTHRHEWANAAARLRAGIPKLPAAYREAPATWRIAEAMMGPALVGAAERSEVPCDLSAVVLRAR